MSLQSAVWELSSHPTQKYWPDAFMLHYRTTQSSNRLENYRNINVVTRMNSSPVSYGNCSSWLQDKTSPAVLSLCSKDKFSEHHCCSFKDEKNHKHDVNRKRKLPQMHLACEKQTASQTQEISPYFRVRKYIFRLFTVWGAAARTEQMLCDGAKIDNSPTKQTAVTRHLTTGVL